MLDVALAASRLFGIKRRTKLRIDPLPETVSAYKAVFRTAHGTKYVLPDLAEFCGVKVPLPSDRDALLRAAGRQDVWLRIQAHLALTNDEVYGLLKGEPVTRER